MAPVINLTRKNNKFDFKPLKGKKFYILQKLKWRIFFPTKKSIIYFLTNHPRTSKLDQKHERTPWLCITWRGTKLKKIIHKGRWIHRIKYRVNICLPTVILTVSDLPLCKRKLFRFQPCNLKILWFWTLMNFDRTKSMIWHVVCRNSLKLQGVKVP